MSTAVSMERIRVIAIANHGSDLRSMADTALRLAARFWFVVVVGGQWIFVSYVIAFYGRSALRGDFAAWNRALPRGYVPGDTIGNLVVAIHLLLAVIIIVGGPLQLIPHIRSYAPSFHRWNGRLYAVTLIVTSIAGVQMVWTRGPAAMVPRLGTSVHALLIIGFAVLAVRYAVARDIGTHRRWALRLFMVINAGWFFRIGLLRRILIDPAFNAATFNGPFLNFMSLADYLLPLIILEMYLRTKERAGSRGQLTMAAVLVALTFVMAFGIFAAATVTWLPRIER